MDTPALEIAVAVAALAVAAAAMVALVFVYRRIRQLRRDQEAVLGSGEPRDLIAHAHELQRRVDEFAARLDALERKLASGLADVETQLSLCLDRHGLVRYDAYNEMSGRQSASLALLDRAGNGLVLSSIVHREQARLYAKRMIGGKADVPLSPEEQQCVEEALARSWIEKDPELRAERGGGDRFRG
ncbi:Protein of unknown function [Thermoleophilum album]|uniref:DUF4446 family protein n=1 Tax=Thermoleophilum album TaxID=29539 RepID=A0A1H6FLS3_THEAL|nr:Protein of unknown function [Thermoleophilum album]